MVKEALGYVDAEELGTKSSQKNLEYNGYRSSIKMVTEELGTKWLRKNLKHNGYRINWSKIPCE
jgi:hypothetical protein